LHGAALHAVARKQGATVSQVVLALSNGLFTIPKASSPEHVRENAIAGDLVRDQEEITLIGERFPAAKRRTPLARA
jgi:diketogulonate reductase-like aldo/keto reductase